MPGSQSTAQAEFSSKHTGSDDARQLPSIVTWIRGMGASYAQEVQKSALRLEDCAATNCANFNTRHRNRDLESAIVANGPYQLMTFGAEVKNLLSHHGNATAAFHILCRILACSQEHSSNNVGGMGIEPSYASGHSTSN